MSDDVFEYDAPSSYDPGGQFLNAEGWFHCVVESVELNPVNQKTKALIPNAAFGVNFGVLAGTVDGQFGKTGNEIFFKPSLDQSEKSQAFAKKKIGRFWKAIGLDSGTAKEGKKIRIDPGLASSRQFIAKFEKTDDGKYIQLAYAEIYHVDDPEVATYPKHKEMLQSYPHRKVGANGSAPQPKGEYKEPSKTQGAISVDDL